MGSFTLSGNEITDAQRLAALDGDGWPRLPAQAFLADAMGHNAGNPYPWSAWEGGAAGQSARVTTPILNPRNDGVTRCYEHSIQSGDVFGGGDRSEFRDVIPGLDAVEGAEWWYGDTIMFPAGQVRPSGWAIHGQFHCQNAAFDQSALKMQWDSAGVDPKGILLPERTSIVLTTGPFANAGEAGAPQEKHNYRFMLWPWELDVWFEYRMFIRWSSKGNGILRCWWRRWDPAKFTAGDWNLAVDRSDLYTIPIILDTQTTTGIERKAGFYRNSQAITNTVRHYYTVRAQSWDECEYGYVPDIRAACLGLSPAVTNLNTNPSLEVDASSYSNQGAAASVSRVTTQHKFGIAALQIVMLAAGSGSSDSGRYQPTLVNGTKYVASAWLRGNVAGDRARHYVVDSLSVNLGTDTRSERADGFMLHQVPFTATGNNPHQIRSGRTAAGADQTLFADGMQLEVGQVATPLTLTSRGASLVVGAASLNQARAGWVAFWLRPWWPSTLPPFLGVGFPRIFSWELDVSNRLLLFWNEVTGNWQFQRLATGAAFQNLVSFSDTFERFERVLVIAAWTADQIAISVNGDPFKFAANNAVPKLEATTFGIGMSVANTDHFHGDGLMGAGGRGFPDSSSLAFLKMLDGASIPVEAMPQQLQTQWVAPFDSGLYDEPSDSGIETAGTWGNFMRDFMRPPEDGVRVGRPRVL